MVPSIGLSQNFCTCAGGNIKQIAKLLLLCNVMKPNTQETGIIFFAPVYLGINHSYVASLQYENAP